MANPSVRNGHIDIANELAEQFARLNLKGEDWRILWVVLRQTWGWKEGDRKKDFDYISLSQFEHKTGMKRANVARVLKRLVAYKLLLKREKGYGINQNYEQWIVAHRLPSSRTHIQVVAHELPKVVAYKLPTIDKKDTFTKESGSAKKLNDDEAGRAFRQAIVKNLWGDNHYADKTWDQGCGLHGDDRSEFMRKVRLVIATVSARPLFAKKIYHEIAGLVNDRGAMRSALTPQEQSRREDFADNNDE